MYLLWSKFAICKGGCLKRQIVVIGLHKLVNVIKVGYLARKATVIVPKTLLNQKLLVILRDLFVINGFVVDETVKSYKSIVVLLKYSAGKPVINNIRVVSEYVSFSKLCNEGKYRHALVVSTSFGVMSRSEALALRIGGIVLIELS